MAKATKKKARKSVLGKNPIVIQRVDVHGEESAAYHLKMRIGRTWFVAVLEKHGSDPIKYNDERSVKKGASRVVAAIKRDGIRTFPIERM